MGEVLIRRTYVIAPSDDAILERNAAKTATSKSAILRRMIREWDAANNQPARTLIDSSERYTVPKEA